MRSSVLTRSSLPRRSGTVVAAGAVLALAAACGGGSSDPAAVPGGGAQATSNADSDAVAALIEAQQPATDLPEGSTAAKIKEKGELTVGGVQTSALFSLLNPTTGKVEGFDAAMSQLLADYIIGEPNTKLVNVTSQTREALIQNGSVDVVFATYTITDERKEKISFAGPYYQDGIGIEVKKGTTGINSLEDLNGKTVVTQSASTAPNAIKAAAPDAKIQLFETNTEALQALRQGRADAYVIDQSILAGNAVTNDDVEVLGDKFSQDDYGIGLAKDDTEFQEFVNDWLQQRIDDGTWAKVWKATVGTEVPGDAPTPPTIG
ncbi:glutamate ABC transporter substrate-binding protein [Kineosporia sp. J2-2]|uniref:Glutamate ABC transporter substrate-binding protein n=1 Tax=Kineosporia corallincola TaxID=2835133 RepID=A0ABS5TQH5_9ACTN|nr:glutamate ABC transporter substrate-binding protein [Kineosporia corallincola]MBT0772303.1 glutamate ABC transporter substrate-binding protein [Kineosporia corallincola]